MNKISKAILQQNDSDIAIVGMSCRLPGGNNSPDDYWEFLKSKGCGIVEVPEDRWGVDVFYDPDPDALSKSVTKWAGFVDNVKQFDAKFFGISPREAASMDPQQRMVLQSSYDAILDSQIPAEVYSEQRTGVFVGISQSDYRTVQEMRVTSTENFAGTGYALCINANRISHRLNLNGPSYAVDTACSSSLTALDQAVRNLHSDSCDMAIVAGVNILGHPSSFVAFSKAGMVSPTGQISTFDSRANGFVRGEAVGVVILKPYKKALEDGDRIHSVIHATNVNQDGFTSTITAPSQTAQINMLEELFEKADIKPSQIGYVEAHGTGTPIGDPIEAGAIGTVIGQSNPNRPVYVGSGKANVGHSESAAGISGLIKATLAVKNGVVPPNINFKKANPYIPFDALNLKVPTNPEPFPSHDGRNYAVVNSFGFGGTNASVLISSPTQVATTPKPVEKTNSPYPVMIPLSATSPEALIENASSILKSLGAKGSLKDKTLREIAYTLGTKRSHLMHRLVILATTLSEFKSTLKKIIKDEDDIENVVKGQQQGNQKLCFVFAGQGSQWWGMARDMLEHDPIFSKAVDDYDTHFKKTAGWSIREELMRDEKTSRIDDTTVTQPALFAIQSGLAAVWKHFGITPDMVAGHSIGEAAASYVAGGLSLAGAAKFLSKRGSIRDQLGAKGAMAAIGLNHEDVEALLPQDGKLGIAAINGPGSTTISGDFDALHAFVDTFKATYPDTFIRALQVDTAWHSYQLEAGEDWFRKEMASIDWSVPNIPFISTVTGKLETRFDTDYGWLNLRRPVLFQSGIETALDLGATTFVELGPHATLAGPTRSTALEAGATVDVLNSISRKESDTVVFARSAAKLFTLGYDLAWENLYDCPATDIELPRYQWSDEEHWRDSEESRKILFDPVKHPFLGMAANGAALTWNSEFSLKSEAFLKDHRMQSDVIFPAAGYIDTIIAMGRHMFGDDAILEIEDSVIHEALFIGLEDEILFSCTYSPERGKVKLYSRVRDANDEWTLRSEAFLRQIDVQPPKPKKIDLTKGKFENIPTDKLYDADGKSQFINYGEAFQSVTDIKMTRSRTVAKIELPSILERGVQRHHLHPSMFDGCLQIIDPRMSLKTLKSPRKAGDLIYLPLGARKMRIFSDFPSTVLIDAQQVKNPEDRNAEGNFIVKDEDGNVVMIVEGMTMRSLPSKGDEVESEEIEAHYVRQEFSEVREPLIENPDRATGHWLLLCEKEGFGGRLEKAIVRAGAQVTRLSRKDLNEETVAESLAEIAATAVENGDLAGIILGWNLSLANVDEETATDELFDQMNASITDLIGVGDFMDQVRTSEFPLPKMVLLTNGAYTDPVTEKVPSRILTQAPFAAAMRGLATETPEYTVRTLEMDDENARSPERLVTYILGDTPETEVILKGADTYAPRLQKVEVEEFDTKLLKVAKSDTSVNFHATMLRPGVIDHVELHEIPLEPMTDDDVRVRISAVGLNFRDIMAVTGLLPEEAEPDPAWQQLGLEFGAVVEKVGKNVKGFKPGDRVMGLGRRCLQRYMTVDPRTLTILPEHISLEQASTIPSAFATAHYALNRVGRMQANDNVFIHVATGGVGTAAVQLAQAAGAEIFATAGSPAKRKILKDQGVPHIMDSRSLKFADDVMDITKGKGVDLLLNSLPGDYIVKGLDIMAPYGRYLEIGKRDVYEDSSIGLKALRKNVSISVLDLAAMGHERPDLLAEMFAELVTKFENKELEPLPLTAFPISQISDAIRYMSQARHVGKVVVTLEDEHFDVRRDPSRPTQLSSDATYLVTGGTAGFTLSIAEWLSTSGAGHLVLASRSGTLDKKGQKLVEKMQAKGTKVTPMALDVTDEVALTKFVKSCQSSKHPLRGVVHGAAVIKDGFANQLAPEVITQVLSPKIAGSWNLHKVTQELGVELDFMIGFSSIAQVIGSAGQSNYIAGNAFLDALSLYRRGNGLNGGAVDWGAIADSGFVARNSALGSYLKSMGLHGLKIKDCNNAMNTSITRDAPAFVYSRAEWPQIARANAALGSSPRIASVMQSEGGGSTEVRSRLLLLEGDELIAEAQEFIKSEITGVLKVDKSTIQADRPMSELGLDSLSSFELKIRVETALDFTLPVSKFLQAPSIAELSVILAEEVEAIKVAEAQAAAAAAAGDGGTDGSGVNTTAQMRLSNQQLGFLRDATAKMSSEYAKLALQFSAHATLNSELSDKDLRSALKKLNKRHPMLRLNILADGACDFEGPGAQLSTDSTLDVSKGEFAKLVTKSENGKLSLSLILNACVSDQKGCEVALSDLIALIEGTELPKPTRVGKLSQVMESCLYDPEDATSQNDRAFWWYSISKGAAAVPFSRRGRALLPVAKGRDHGPKASITGTLSTTISERDAIIAFAHALRHTTDSSGPVIMSRYMSVRELLDQPTLVTPLTIAQPLLSPDHFDDTKEVAKLGRTLSHAENHLRFDSSSAETHLDMHFDEWGSHPSQIGFGWGQDAKLAPQGCTHDVALSCSVNDKGQLTYCLDYDSDVLCRETAEQIEASFKAALNAAQSQSTDADAMV